MDTNSPTGVPLPGVPSLNASAPSFAPPGPSAQTLQALLASVTQLNCIVKGLQRVDITAERENAAASPDCPLFLHGVWYCATNTRLWYDQVLPAISKYTFVISSTADITYSSSIFSSAALPYIYSAVIKVELPKFYWFSGVALNRHHNPYLQLCANLPNLQELSITFHTAGLTNPRWTERQACALERNQPEAAKERILLPLREVVLRYELDAVFSCGRLRRLQLSYIESEMTAYFCKVGSPLNVLDEIATYLGQGFTQRGMQVFLEILRVEVDILT